MDWSKKFKEKVREIENEQGRCSLRTNNYAFINGRKTFNNKTTLVKVHWICEQRNEKDVLTLLDGSTGYEQWYLKDLVKDFSQEPVHEFFTACMGSLTYPKLELDWGQMKSVVMQLNSQFN
ncbi:MAG: hypothetical protein QNJ63_02470 [Calothrix sp. MO_192.B10]|nr:hypothetical protein [Calothrix sp. MO_192.B10]